MIEVGLGVVMMTVTRMLMMIMARMVTVES